MSLVEFKQFIKAVLSETGETSKQNFSKKSLFENYVHLTLLVEGRLENAKKKYPNVNVDMLARLDPSGNLAYLDWICKQMSDKSQRNRLEDVGPTVQAFHNVKDRLDKKDINSYSTTKQLEDAIKNVPESRSEKKKIIKADGAVVMFETPEYTVMRMDSKDACVLYGKGTRWCITMKEHEYHKFYKEGGSVFYFMLPKIEGEKYQKYAIQIKQLLSNRESKITVWDPTDTVVSNSVIEEFLSQNQIDQLKNDATIHEDESYKKTKILLTKEIDEISKNSIVQSPEILIDQLEDYTINLQTEGTASFDNLRSVLVPLKKWGDGFDFDFEYKNLIKFSHSLKHIDDIIRKEESQDRDGTVFLFYFRELVNMLLENLSNDDEVDESELEKIENLLQHKFELDGYGSIDSYD